MNEPGNLEKLTKKGIAQFVLQEAQNERSLTQQDIQSVVGKTLDCITGALARGQTVELRNFGVFDVVLRSPRVGRNPNRPETDVEIPRRAVVKFKAGKELKAALKQLDLDDVGSADAEPASAPSFEPPKPDFEPPKPDPSPFGGY